MNGYQSYNMAKTNTGPSDGDLIRSRTAINLANAQRALASWFPQSTADGVSSRAETEEDLDEEDDFTSSTAAREDT